MTSPTNYYVDPLSGNDTTGDGSISTPWATVQHALDTITRDATNGDQINIRDTAVITLTISLTAATYGIPSYTAPLIFRGYSNAADDGGVATLVGDGVAVYSEAAVNKTLIWQDLILSSDAVYVVDQSTNSGCECYFINCELSGGSTAILRQRGLTNMLGCYIHDFVTVWAGLGVGTNYYFGNYFENSTFRGVTSAGTNNDFINNVFVKTGVYMYGLGRVIGNTFINDGSGGYGVFPRNSGQVGHVVLNNLFVGFSGVSQQAIDLTNTSQIIEVLGHNKFYNCTINIGSSGFILLNLGNNDTLLENPLVDAANLDYGLVSGSPARSSAFPATYLGTITDSYGHVGGVQSQAQAAGGGRRPRARIHGV